MSILLPGNLPNPFPRSFPELQTERSYLLSSLNVENLRATGLLCRIPPLEESLISNDSIYAKRKTRKQLGWLKHRLEETIYQEQTILQRLGQLTWEIQQRERGHLLEEERRNQQGLWRGMQNVTLNAAAPEFHPQNQWHQQYQEVDYFGYDWEFAMNNFAAERLAEDRNRTGQHENEKLSHKDLAPTVQVWTNPQYLETEKPNRPLLWHRSSSFSAAILDLMATNNEYAVAPEVKRNSLPTLSGIASFSGPTKDDFEEKGMRRSSDDEGYVGFHVGS